MRNPRGARTPRQVYPRGGVVGGATKAALVAFRLFKARKEILLGEVAAERRTPRDVLDSLELYYAKLTREFLRAEPTAYSTWHEKGPREELLEVRTAHADAFLVEPLNPTAWTQLVAKFAERTELVDG